MILAKYWVDLNKWYHHGITDRDGTYINILQQIKEKFGLTFIPEPINYTQGDASNVCMANSPEVRDDYQVAFAPIDLLDYIYAVLHSPSYTEKYMEILNIDFARLPYPKESKIFWQLVRLGGELRQLHLLESPKVMDYITSYPKAGSNGITTKIGKKDWETLSLPFEGSGKLGRIWINETQYFDNIPLTAWEFYNGSYQPAQKWLKDRRGRILDFEEILHFQKIIVALTETNRVMQKIATIKF